MLFTLLDHTALICQANKTWISTVLTNQKLTLLYSFYAVLHESGYTGPVVNDANDTDVYIAAPYISHQLAGMLCIKRKQETILCHSLVSKDMARCIIQLHYITGCDANSSFYGKGKSLVYDKVTRSVAAQHTLLKCGDSLDFDENILMSC